MIECALQLKNNTLYPFSQEDRDNLREFKDNQVLKAKLYGVQKQRSYKQLKLYFACCQTVADNMENMTKEDVDFECRIRLKFIKDFRVVGKMTYVEPRSISYAELPHIEACNYFDRAFPIMAKMIGITVDELLINSE